MCIHGYNGARGQDLITFFNMLSTNFNFSGNGQNSISFYNQPSVFNNTYSYQMPNTYETYQNQFKMLMDALGLLGSNDKQTNVKNEVEPKNTTTVKKNNLPKITIDTKNVVNENSGLEYYSKDKNGNLIHRKYGDDGVSYTETHFFGNDKNKPSQIYSYKTVNGKETLAKETWYSYISGKPHSEIEYGEDNTRHEKWYDVKKGYLTTESHYSKNNYTKKYFDESGNIKDNVISTENEDGSTTRKYFGSPDKEDRHIVARLNPNSTGYSDKYIIEEFDKDGKLIETRFHRTVDDVFTSRFS